jgi:hypothetical protein
MKIDFDVCSKNIISSWFSKYFGELLKHHVFFEKNKSEQRDIASKDESSVLPENCNPSEVGLRFLKLRPPFDIKYDASLGSSKDYYDEVIRRVSSGDQASHAAFKIVT